MPDFYIGAHAVIEGPPLLTGDVKRYRIDYTRLELMCPSNSLFGLQYSLYHNDIPSWRTAMPKMSVRATYALDNQTDARIRELAERWRVSKAEVIRRSVPQAAEAEGPKPPTPAEVIARYRRGPLPRSAEAAKQWAIENRAARHALDKARTGTPKP